MKVALIFPGQGAQKEGMGHDFYATFEDSKALYDAYPLIRDVCFFNQDNGLSSTLTTQQAILLTSVGMAKQVMKHIEVSAMAGLSLGEYSALVCANALSLEEAMPLIQQRGQLMSDALQGYETGMSAIISDQLDIIEEIIQDAKKRGVCSLANYNSPTQFVMSGDGIALAYAKQRLNESGIRKVIPLKVAGAFHSSYLEKVAPSLNDALREVNWRPSQCPVIMNVSGQAQTHDFIPALTQQIYSSVKWMQSLQTLQTMGIDTLIEIGPQTTLSSMIQATCPELKHFSVNDVASLNQLLKENI